LVKARLVSCVQAPDLSLPLGIALVMKLLLTSHLIQVLSFLSIKTGVKVTELFQEPVFLFFECTISLRKFLGVL
jgi:hypothetical protein